MSELFREVDEALREDRAKILWQKYGNIGIAVVAAVLLATAGYVFWQDYADKRDQELTGVLLTALEQSDTDPTGAMDALAALGEDQSGRQGVLARLHEAALRLEAGDANGAVDIYRMVADDSGVPDAWRDLALADGGAAQPRQRRPGRAGDGSQAADRRGQPLALRAPVN